MEVNRKVNVVGTIIGAIGVFGIIFSLLILMNSISFMKGIADQGQVSIPAAAGFEITDQDGNIIYHIVYATDDGNITVELPATKEDIDDFSPETTAPIVRRVFTDSYGNYYCYEDLNATENAVLQEVNMPMTLPIIGLVASVIITILGFAVAFKGKPTEGKDLGEIIQAKREAEEAEEAAEKAAEEAEKAVTSEDAAADKEESAEEDTKSADE